MSIKKSKICVFIFILLSLILILSCSIFESPAPPPTNPVFAKYDETMAPAESSLKPEKPLEIQVSAQKVAETPDYQISLYEAIILTLENNLDIKVSNLDSQISKYELEAQKGIYDTIFKSKYTEAEEDTQTSVDPGKTRAVSSTMNYYQRSRTRSAELALAQLIPTGAYLELKYTHTRVDFKDKRGDAAFDPYYSEDLGLSLRQPILKGAGPTVTNAGINIARINKKINTESLKKKIMDQIYEVVKTYWDLSYAIDNLKVLEISLKQAQDLQRINTIKFETGVLPSTDVLQAKAKVATREEQIIVAQASIKAYQDRLKQLMNIKEGCEKWNVTFVPKEKPIIEQAKIDQEGCFKEALEKHPDVVSLKKAIEIAKINVAVNKNLKNPELNLFGEYGYTGRGDSTSNAMNKLTHRYYNDWAVGLEFAYPLLNREGRNNYNKSLVELQKAETQLNNVENLIALGIRNSIRDTETNFKRVDITKTSVEFEEAKLDAEQKRYDVGMSTSFNILTFQEDLALAKSLHLSSIIAFNKAIAGLEYSKGTILDTLKIKIEEPKEEESSMDKLFEEGK